MYKRFSIFILFAVTIVTFFLGYNLLDLRFDYDLENFFPEDDPATEFYEEYRKKFGSDNDYLLIGIRNEEGVFKEEFLNKVKDLSDSLREVKDVREVVSPLDLKYYVRDPLMGQVFERDYIHEERPANYEEDSSRIWQTEELIGNFFSKDGRSLTILIHNTPFLAKEPSDSVAVAVQKTVSSFDFDEVHIAGRVVAQKYYVDKMKNDLIFFISTSFLVTLVFLVLAFRSIWGVIVPVTIVVLTVVWILGVMGAIGEPINLLLTILPTIMFVVGVSDVVHIVSKYLEELRRGFPKLQAIRSAFKEIGFATFLTSLTTSIGFLTLISSNIPPIKDFGIYTAIGVFIALVLAFSILPSILTLMGPPRISQRPIQDLFWNHFLHKGFRWTLRNRIKSTLGFLTIIILSLISISHIKVNNHLLEDLKKDDPLKQDFLFFEEDFAGVRPFELYLKVEDPKKDVLDPIILMKLDSLEQFLEGHFHVGSIISPLTLVKNANMALHGGNPEYHKVPGSKKELERIAHQLEKFRKSDRMRNLITEDLMETRITGKMPDLGSYRVRKLKDSLHNFMEKGMVSKDLEYRITGSANLIDRNNKFLSTNMMEGLLIAFGVIGLIVAALFRSVKMTLVALIPNIFPLLMVGGIMGVLGIPLKVSTSIIFTIAFGIAVDDTIHFTSRLKLELNKGRSLVYAVKRTYLSTGKAILVTTMILCGGFITLVFSDFLGTFNIGFLISLALFFAVLGDLFLLPPLLFLFFKKGELEKKDE